MVPPKEGEKGALSLIFRLIFFASFNLDLSLMSLPIFRVVPVCFPEIPSSSLWLFLNVLFLCLAFNKCKFYESKLIYD